MGKRVILTLMPGSFEQGFPVILRIKSDGAPAETGIQVIGQLPPAPNILEVFKQWQSAYRQIVMPHSRIKSKPGQVTNFSCHQLGTQLAECLNDWLNSGSSKWQKIRDRLQQNLSETEEILVLIETDDLRLRQLPWHLWDLFSKHYTQAEIALSTSEYQPLDGTTATLTDKVRILAILGNSTGIDVQQDRAILEQLPHAEITFLVEPQRQRLSDRLWEQQWDILFFAGHSFSQVNGNTGQIYINQTDSLSLTELKNALIRAISGGMQLAIFNSCDGLGLARELADLHIPQIVVMREPVPDKVAQEFLQHFLSTFASGKSLYLAVREARERLQGLEAEFPCATWLPVLCQNPAVVPRTWQQLCGQTAGSSGTGTARQQHRQIFRSSRLKTILLFSVVVTALVMGVRHLGILQPLELQAFDHLMQRKPLEQPDKRLLIVEATEEDIGRYHYPITDETLALLLKKLGQFKPRIIGLDIYRDRPEEPGHSRFVAELQQNERLVVVCKIGEENDPAVSPPSNPVGILVDRLGFSDVVVDPDDIVRRHLLSRSSDGTSPCDPPNSLSFQLALHYLDDEGYQPKLVKEYLMKWRNAVFKPLEAHTGAYQGLDAHGYQVMLNYRRTSEPIAQTVTLKDVLNDQIDPDWVKGRIVLIGVTAPSVKDDFSTPFGQQKNQKIRGLLLQAQMVSQIVSAVKDGRPLLWAWPSWGEALWVWSWSLVGGVLVWRWRSRSVRSLASPLTLGLAETAALVTLYGLCFVLFRYGGWVPLVPSALALILIATGGSILVYITLQTQRQQ